MLAVHSQKGGKMSKRNFQELLETQWSKEKFVCIGLDPEMDKLPTHLKMLHLDRRILYFCEEIVCMTAHLVCAYKPNTAFFERHGTEGWIILRRLVESIHNLAPNIPIILDAKRGDIGNTNNGYIDMAFDFLEVDAITVNPYLGREALQPFLDRQNKGIIVLCRTSNPGAGEFQDMIVKADHTDPCEGDSGYMPLYKYIAQQVVHHWNKNGNCAIVAGATYPSQLREIREIVGDMPILIPGIGFQQKDVPLEEQVKQVVECGQDSHGQGMIINSSRGIIFASKDNDFAKAARQETLKLHNTINQYRQKKGAC